MGIEEGTLLARGALSTLNREHRYLMEELRKVCNAIQARNITILTDASKDEFLGNLGPMVNQQESILQRLASLKPQREALKLAAWGHER